MKTTRLLTAAAGAALLGPAALAQVGQTPNADGSVIARWGMDPAAAGPFAGGNPVTLDSRTAAGEGVNLGFAFGNAAQEDLWTFNALGGAYAATTKSAPASLFNPLQAPTTSFSYDAGAILGVNGALFYPEDQYGGEFGFYNGFTLETVFRTDGDQSAAGNMQLLNQGEGFFRYGLIVNEGSAGNVRFAVNDGAGNIVITDLRGATARNYADGEWHYVKAVYDPAIGTDGAISITATNEDGTSETSRNLLPAGFQLPREGFGAPDQTLDGNMFIGRNTFSDAADPRTFVGEIDELQITAGNVGASDMLGVVNTSGNPTASNAVVARWDMVASPPFVQDANGNPATLDTRTAPGEGVLIGFNAAEAVENLHFFGATDDGNGGLNPANTFTTSSDTAPAALFANGNTGNGSSYDASVLSTLDEGALFYPRNRFGNEFGFDDAFSVEMMFRTDGNQAGVNDMQLISNGEVFARFGITVNESGPGELRFFVNDGDQIEFVDLGAGNYADGEWHYLLATYDPSVGSNGEIAISVSNEDMTTDTASLLLSATFDGLPTAFDGISAPSDGNLLIGTDFAGDFANGLAPGRVFQGLIDEIQISAGIVGASDRLGVLFSAAPLPGDANGDGAVDLLDFDVLAQNFGSNTGNGAADGDFNGDGAVDLLDFDILAQNFGATSPGSVPEPASAALLGLGGAALLRRRRRTA